MKFFGFAIFQTIFVVVNARGWQWRPMHFGGGFPMHQMGRQVPEGQCCYCIRAGCDVINYPAYKRIANVSSEDQCIQNCAAEPNNYCKSAVLNQRTQTCDLFERYGDKFPASLNYRPGSAYYSYCKKCDCPNYKIVPCGGPAPSQACQSGETAFMIRNENVVPNFEASGQPFSSTEEECRESCRQQKDGSGAAQTCLSAVFNSATGQCTFYNDKAANKPTSVLQSQPGVVYFELLCLPADAAAACQDAPNQLLESAPGKFLQGHVSEELNQPSLEACMIECIKRGSSCKSGDYFYGASPNCLLQTESRATRPDVFGDQEEDPVTYFDNNCQRNFQEILRVFVK